MGNATVGQQGRGASGCIDGAGSVRRGLGILVLLALHVFDCPDYGLNVDILVLSEDHALLGDED
jgi:hypothetical protein